MLNVFFNFKYWYKRIMKHLLHNPFASSLEYSAKAECSSYILFTVHRRNHQIESKR